MRRDYLKHLGFTTATAIATSKIKPLMNTEPTIEEMNKAIAAFMGYFFHAGKYYANGLGRGKWFKEPKYDISWDWLMPVVKKIHSLAVAGDAINAITEEAIFTFSIFAPLKDVHLAVYQFITWYNQQKQNDETNNG